MALFNNISFHSGFFNDMSSWLMPNNSFWNPVGWNIFHGWEQLNIWDFNVSSSPQTNPFYNENFNSWNNPSWANTPTNTSVWNNWNNSSWTNTPLNTSWNNWNPSSWANIPNASLWNNWNLPNYYKPTSNSNIIRRSNSSSITQLSDNISISGYNPERGLKLAQIAKRRATGSKHCAKYVREALNISGILTTAELGNLVHEHAYQWIGILRKFPNKFKEIKVTDTNYKHLPAGAIMIYERGVLGYNNESGHAQIATGDGKAAHYKIATTLKKPTAIFVPI